MINQILEANFLLIQFGFLSLVFNIGLERQAGYSVMYNNSVLYKINIVSLILALLILIFLQLPFFTGLFYIICSFLIQSFVGGLLLLIFIPKSFLNPKQIYITRPFSHKVASMLIVVNFILMAVITIVILNEIIF